MNLGTVFPFSASQRVPDPRFEVLHESARPLRLFSSTVEQLASGLRWAEGPVWFGDGRFLLVSDIPNDRILRWDECSGHTTIYRSPSGFANGMARDRQGRLLACEHFTRRVTRTEYDGSITVLADQFDGKRLNSPNDLICDRAGNIWFTDPTFGISGWWEGQPAVSERPHALYRIDAITGQLECMLDDLDGPNGLAFNSDQSVLYVVESRAEPHRLIWAYDVGFQGQLKHKRLHIDANGPGALDGIAVDVDGRIWAGFGSDGRDGASGDGLDGVRVYDLDGGAIAHIHLPERCANVCFGGRHLNRLFMAATHSLYSVTVNTIGC